LLRCYQDEDFQSQRAAQAMRERTRHAARGAEDGHLRAAGLWCRTTWQNDIDHSSEKFAKNDYGYAFDNRRRCARLEKGLFR